MTIFDLKKYYEKVNYCCESYSLGLIYNHRLGAISKIRCDKFHCARCRPKIVYKLRHKVQAAITEHDLKTHIVITTEGTDYRTDHDYQESYIDMGRAWIHIRRSLSYDAAKQGIRLSYICMTRAQKSGYAHLHILTNAKISKQRMTSIAARYPNTGFVKIKQHTNTANYLTNDFNNDHEWHIPLGRRHYSCSQDIDLDIHHDEADPSNVLHIRLVPHLSILDQVYDQIDSAFSYPPPLEFMLETFSDIDQSKLPLLGGLYIDGVLVDPLIDPG